jgi:hypothetical protein
MQTSRTDERRRFHRILLDTPATIHQQEVKLYTRLIDISLNGVLLRRPTAWQDGTTTPIKISIHLDSGITIRMQAVIAHNESDRLGFHCQEIDMASISHLRRLVELNLNDPDLLDRELGALLRETG